MIDMKTETDACMELLEADGKKIEHILNTLNEGHGGYTNDIIGFALMGLARNIQRLDRRINHLRAATNSHIDTIPRNEFTDLGAY
jgi:hypothetical protein